MKVYHIVKKESELVIGDVIQPKTYNLEDFSVKKRQIEEELENVRRDNLQNLYHIDPQRLM